MWMVRADDTNNLFFFASQVYLIPLSVFVVCTDVYFVM